MRLQVPIRGSNVGLQGVPVGNLWPKHVLRAHGALRNFVPTTRFL